MKKQNWVFALALIALTVVFIFRGSYSTINELDTVSGIAIDYKDDKWRVVCEICTPSSDNDYGSASVYVKGSADTLSGAFDEAGKASANILYTDCVQLYLVGEGARGKQELLNYFLQDNVNLRAVTANASPEAAIALCGEADSENSRAKSMSIAKKVKRYCSENGLPSPRVTQYLKGKAGVGITKDNVPERMVIKHD